MPANYRPPRIFTLMNFPIDAIRNTRNWVLQLTEGLSEEALNMIPPGFNNNIIWNMGHLVAAEQGVLYVRGGANPRVDMDFLKKYTRGTKPEGLVSGEEIARVRTLLTSTLPGLEADLKNGIFGAYNAWTTPYDVELQTIEDALQFLLFHEGIHSGYIMALKRVVS